jgi:zeta-carotene desaturase
VKTSDGEFEAENVVLALPFEQTQKLLLGIDLGTGLDPQTREAANALEAKTERFIHSPFTSILLWYDREITELDHAWLLDTTIEWFFHKSRIRGYAPGSGSYVEVVVAGSRAQLGMGREEILNTAQRELQLFFPKISEARLLKSGVLKEARATFSVTPGLDAFRPRQQTDLPGLFLAGDWTATDWPSTMESGVRSGRLAAGAVLGEERRFMAPETPAGGLMRWLLRP